MTKAEIEKFLIGLADEVIGAAIHYKLYRELVAKVQEYEREFNQTVTFWSMTFNAHIATARAALFRAYDSHRDGLNFIRLLENVGPHCNVSQSEIDADKARVSRTDPVVAKFIWQRNNLFAHKNLANVLQDRKPQLSYSLPETDFEDLLARAVEILNKYETAVRGHAWSTQIFGHDDFQFVLKAIRQWIELHEQKIEAEIAEYNRKPPQL